MPKKFPELFLILYNLAVVLLPVVVALLTPGGRRGKIFATRVLQITSNDANYLRQLYAARFVHENFELTPTADGFKATRSSKSPAAIFASSFDISSLVAQMEFLTISAEVIEARLRIAFDDTVFKDTGEVAYVEMMADRLMSGDQSVPAPIIANSSAAANTALYGGALLIPALGLFFAWNLGTKDAQALLVFFLFCSVTPMVMAGWAFLQVVFKPARVVGMRKDVVGAVLALCADVAAVAIYFMVL